MAQENPILDAAQASVPASQEAIEARPCPDCLYDLSCVPGTARFCPRCGSSVDSELEPQPIPFATPVYISDTADVSRQLERLRPMAARSIQHAAARAGWSILTGYASALFKLGLRYETALGSTQNPQEALRCYEKAARLNHTATDSSACAVEHDSDL